jgi:hypothetical protein
MKQHNKPTPNDITDENDLPPYLVNVALHPILIGQIGKSSFKRTYQTVAQANSLQ